MKFTQLFFVVILSTVFSCTDSTEASIDSSVATETKPFIGEEPAQEDVLKIAKKENQLESTKDNEVDNNKDLISKKEEVEQKPEIEEKSEAYKKASEERRKKRRAAREEKRKKEAAAKTSKDVKESIKTTTKSNDDLGVKIEASGSGKPIVDFKETEFNFGVIKQGEKINHDFVFENTGDGDLEILNVNVTCGCTTPTFPFLPIEPGQKGTIGVSYNSTGKLGNQKPMITVITNAKPHTYKIYLKGVVDAERSKTDKLESNTSTENN